MTEGGRQNWLWYAARCAILVAVALACPILGYSRGRILLPTDTLTPANTGNAGVSMASSADGSIVVVGVPNATVSGQTNAGAAYVFVEPASGWGSATAHPVELYSFNPVADALFGTSVAISSDGSTVVVGAPGDNGGAGAAWVLNEPSGVGGWSSATSVSQNIEITAGDPQSGAMFGASVGISGDGGTIVVGASNWADTAGNLSNVGTAYVFTSPVGTWTQESGDPTSPTPTPTIAAPSPAAGQHFSSCLAINGDASVITVGTDDANSQSQGVAYIFTAPTGTWTELVGLSASDGGPADLFGSSVAISGTTTVGTTVVVGAPGLNSGVGAAYVFNAPTGTWAQVAELTASSPTAGSQLGTSVAISSDATRVLAGSLPVQSSAGGYSPGILYQFNQPSRGPNVQPWANATQSAVFQDSKSSQTADDGFASSVAVGIPTSGRAIWLFGGAPGTSSGQGAAYVFQSK